MTAALAELVAREAQQAGELEQLRSTIETIRRFCGTTAPIRETNGHNGETKAAKSGTRRSPVAPGSVPDRILGILREAGEPVNTKHVVQHAGAKLYTVRQALAQLLKDKRIVRTGATASLRYAVGG